MGRFSHCPGVSYFDDFMRRSSSGLDLRPDELVSRMLDLLEDTTISKEEHDWWCRILEVLGSSMDNHEWETSQDFFFTLLKSLDRKEIYVGDDITQMSRHFFENAAAPKRSASSESAAVRLGAGERQHAQAVVARVFFCRQYYLTGRCQLGGDCSLEHCCHACLKKTGRRYRHTVHECDVLIL